MRDDPASLISVKEASRILARGERTIRKMLSSGELPHQRVGNRRLMPRAEVEEFLTMELTLGITVREASEKLGLVEGTVRWLMRTGKLPYRKFRRRYFIHPSAIEEFRETTAKTIKWPFMRQCKR